MLVGFYVAAVSGEILMNGLDNTSDLSRVKFDNGPSGVNAWWYTAGIVKYSN